MSTVPPVAPTRPDRASSATLLRGLLETCPEKVYFKDRQSRFILVSRSLIAGFGKTRPSEVVGHTDFDFYTEEHAKQAFEDEQAIIRTGMPMLGKLEKEPRTTGRITWALTTKLPLRNAAGEIIGTFGVSQDITGKKEIEAELEKAHRDLVLASRIAGMAEVATGVLHNVGNVLNSLNVSASVISTGLRQSKVESLSRLSALLHEHQADLGAFLSSDPRGHKVPEFLTSLARHSVEERDRLTQELTSLQKNIDHIKEIVTMQQAYATMVGVVEPLDPVVLMEDALRMNSGALQRREIGVVRDFQPVPRALGEQAKVLQILVNLIRNAQYACEDRPGAGKVITLRIRTAGTDRVQVIVQDNGVGIPRENLTRIFQHGFTTRTNGHGFGLHSAANAAREMRGTLIAHSDGPGTGATFTLELPAADAPASK